MKSEIVTLIYLIAKQTLSSEKVLNGTLFPPHFLFSAYVVANKRAVDKKLGKVKVFSLAIR